MTRWVRLVLSWILLPLRLLWGIPQNLSNLVSCRDFKTPCKARNHQHLTMHSPKRLQSLKDHVVQRTTDSRRRVVEVHAATAEDVNIAVEAARRALLRNRGKDWASATGAHRAKYLRAIAAKTIH